MSTLKEEIKTTLENAGETHAGYLGTNLTDLATVVGNVILAILTITGLIFLVLIVYAGFKWMLAQGEEQKITEARNLIIHSTIGLIVVITAYAVSTFIVKAIQGIP